MSAGLSAWSIASARVGILGLPGPSRNASHAIGAGSFDAGSKIQVNLFEPSPLRRVSGSRATHPLAPVAVQHWYGARRRSSA